MIRRQTTARSILAALAALMSLAAASAADLDDEIRQEAGITHVEYASGWYLRGDIGTFHGSGTATYPIGGTLAIDDVPMFNDLSLGVGVGYIFNESTRADITINYFGGFDINGATALGSCGAGYTGECFNRDDANLGITAFEANGYWSAGTWNGLKPYVGGGLGLAVVQWKDYSSQPYCVLDPAETCDGATHSGGLDQETLPAGAPTTSHGRSTLAAFSLMLGTDYRINEYWTLDLGYKYTRLVDVGLNNNPADTGELDSISIHQFRAGLRYEIW